MMPARAPGAVKPVLFVTGHAPAYRVGAFARLHERERIELALFGGRLQHGGAATSEELPFAHRHVRPHELFALASSGDYRAVVCPTGGRVAALATWAGARRAHVPLILWASLWAHPRSAAHALSYFALRRLYRSADAVVTYGPHVSAYVSARGAHNVHVAAQAVDNDFWRASASGPSHDPRWPWTPASGPPDDPRRPSQTATRFLFVGRPVAGKGLPVLAAAWRAAGLAPGEAALVLAGGAAGSGPDAGSRPDAGPDPAAPGAVDPSIVSLGALTPEQLRDVYAACDVLVVPSQPTRTFREPWGLVVNEAMNQGLAVIATDAVGAAGGGLVRDGANGVIVPAGDERALAAAIARLARDPQLRTGMGRTGAADVLAYDYDAWSEGFSRALADLGVARGHW
jgi:glycosyltransferase involved in cell wall biosynthesis